MKRVTFLLSTSALTLGGCSASEPSKPAEPQRAVTETVDPAPAPPIATPKSRSSCWAQVARFPTTSANDWLPAPMKIGAFDRADDGMDQSSKMMDEQDMSENEDA